jgi:hypothetical protein
MRQRRWGERDRAHPGDRAVFWFCVAATAFLIVRSFLVASP